jgi:hypothetical protein
MRKVGGKGREIKTTRREIGIKKVTPKIVIIR